MRVEIVFIDGAYTDYIYDVVNYYVEDGVLWVRNLYGTTGFPLVNVRTAYVKSDAPLKELAPVDYMDV